MTPEGKATSLCSLSWFFPSLSAEKDLFKPELKLGSKLILRAMEAPSLWGWSSQQMEQSRENGMQLEKIARGIQAEDYPLQLILFICVDTGRCSEKWERTAFERDKRKCSLIQGIINSGNVWLQGDPESSGFGGFSKRGGEWEGENSSITSDKIKCRIHARW